MSTKFSKHNLLLSICLVIMFFVTNACKKDEAQPEPNPVLGRAMNEKQLQESTFGVGVKDIEYDTDKQPKKFVTGGMRAEVTYENTKVVFSFYGQDLVKKKVYEIENGLVKTVTEYNYIGTPGIETFKSSFTYNGERITKEVVTFEGKPYGVFI
jgi:hypothetical protein